MEDATGELPLSDRAVVASERAQKIAQDAMLGVHNAHLNAAIMAALEGLPVFVDAVNDGGRGKYANLRDILEAVRPALYAQGVRIRQGADRSFMLDEGGGMKGRLVPVFTDLIHVESGELERTTVEIPVVRLDPQAMGSAVTYGKRYTLLAGLGLATAEADDDGERATPRALTGAPESALLVALKKEIDACKDGTDLAEWVEGVKSKKRAEKLSEAEHAVLGAHYQASLRNIMDAPADAPPAKKTRKAAE